MQPPADAATDDRAGGHAHGLPVGEAERENREAVDASLLVGVQRGLGLVNSEDDARVHGWSYLAKRHLISPFLVATLDDVKPLVTAACLLALFCLEAAVAAAPEGFRDSARLTPRAQAISGNTAAVVYCARTPLAWEGKVREHFGPDASAYRTRAMTVYAENAAYFSQSVCLALEKWLRGKRVSAWDVGISAHTFAHEAVHLSGVVDEQVAECSSLRALPETLRQQFGVRKPTTLKAMVAAAKTVNRRSPRAC